MNPSSELRQILDSLPFRLDDTSAANDAFGEWMESGSEQAKKHADLWTYCYIWSYFLGKFSRESAYEASDMDELIARAYEKVERNRTEVEQASRYASWVSVICKNTFLNHARRDRVAESIDDEGAPQLVADAPVEPHDDGYIRQAIAAAIRRLPEYLQETARLRFLEKCSFQEIAEVVGKSVATVRTYKFKAVKRLRKDPELRDLL